MLNLSTILVHSITLHVNQPFRTVIEKSGVETRSSKQKMLSDEAHVLLVTNSSTEEDSETDNQSYPPPPEVHALTWQGYVAHIMRILSCKPIQQHLQSTSSFILVLGKANFKHA